MMTMVGLDICPNCGEFVEFKELSTNCVDTHGLDCGPYERWTETWLECSRCKGKTNMNEIAKANKDRKDYEWECFVKVLPASYRYKVWAETEEEARDLANSAFYDDYGNVERQVEEVNKIIQ